MAEKTLVQKLSLKPGYRAVILNAPESYLEGLQPLPERVSIVEEVRGVYDFVQVFVRSRKDIETQALDAIAALQPGGVLWFTYPKKSSGIHTDVTRDFGWETVYGADYGPVSNVSLDDTWSCLRFKPEKTIDRKADSQFRKK
ncbi:MAG: hypothetical protein J0M07_15275 [Anaerolineae bacterium]|nr:hypothetical protein [Anaerolineae bacterium]